MPVSMTAQPLSQIIGLCTGDCILALRESERVIQHFPTGMQDRMLTDTNPHPGQVSGAFL